MQESKFISERETKCYKSVKLTGFAVELAWGVVFYALFLLTFIYFNCQRLARADNQGLLTCKEETNHFQRLIDLLEASQGLAITIGTRVITTKGFASTCSRTVSGLHICKRLLLSNMYNGKLF